MVMREWMPTADNFGTRLAMVRQGMGWNVTEAALACGVTPTTWRKWEFEGARPRDYMGVAKAVSARTAVSLQWLVFGSDHRAVDGPLPAVPTVRVYEDEESGTSYDVPLRDASEEVLCAIRDSNPEPADLESIPTVMGLYTGPEVVVGPPWAA
ncbi:transcriptional repressor [Gordonia phage EricDab]|uniref:Immunity repressor n=1 Tax=Gordonia phage EricDab TaxID=3070616 RepID=A0A4D6E3F4_9CAUD|nr:transcriptional repressor [Gordonia phage EricDab]QBZ73190.1 immunity repressor [Gordonia phage EricDab]